MLFYSLSILQYFLAHPFLYPTLHVIYCIITSILWPTEYSQLLPPLFAGIRHAFFTTRKNGYITITGLFRSTRSLPITFVQLYLCINISFLYTFYENLLLPCHALNLSLHMSTTYLNFNYLLWKSLSALANRKLLCVLCVETNKFHFYKSILLSKIIQRKIR